MKKETQKDRVIQWLKSGQTLTPKQAYFNNMGMRLGAIIWILIHEEGYDIENISNTKYAEYKLIKVGFAELK